MNRLARIAAVAAIAVGLITPPPALATAPATAPGPVADVVALGDSYASGEGAADFAELEGVTPCHRSPVNVSAVATTAVDDDWTRVDATCSGAETPDLVTPQALDDGTTNAPQLDSLSTLAPDGARMVTLSIGGNDAGFGSVLLECVLVGLGAIELFEGRLGEDGPGEGIAPREGETCEECSAEEAERGGPPQCPESEQVVNRGPRTEEYLTTAFADTLAATYDQVIAELVEVTSAWGAVDLSRAVIVYVTARPHPPRRAPPSSPATCCG